ncbi:MAG: hypothetical protein EAZ11_09085 [Curvibacter sp.]|nr:MAG: hypothetical protein EAZ11_09085 [Curvibacter sp.]
MPDLHAPRATRQPHHTAFPSPKPVASARVCAQPANFDLLRFNGQWSPNVQVHRCGLGDACGVFELIENTTNLWIECGTSPALDLLGVPERFQAALNLVRPA